MSFDLILPFLRPIADLIQDPDISEIMVNGSRRIFIERQGRLQEVTGVRLDERNLTVAVKNIARALGDDISEEQPILDSRLPDGSRVAAILPPCSVGGTTLTIRKFQTRFYTAEELVRIGTMTPDVLDAVRDGDHAEPQHPHQRRHEYGQDDAAERARGLPAAERPCGPHRGNGRAAARPPEPRPVRGPAIAG